MKRREAKLAFWIVLAYFLALAVTLFLFTPAKAAEIGAGDQGPTWVSIVGELAKGAWAMGVLLVIAGLAGHLGGVRKSLDTLVELAKGDLDSDSKR